MVNRDSEIENRIRELRKEYGKGFELELTSMNPDPVLQFTEWFELMLRAGLPEPNAMALATVGEGMQPSLRMVLLKHFSTEGFNFYTNYLSRKGREIEKQQRAALLFFWAPFERQIRIEGAVEKMSREDSLRYFGSRPRGSQLGAAASPQSSVITDRKQLETLHAGLDREYQNRPIPCPEQWGGYLLKADYFEFWQGRENRLHDRISYKRAGNSWLMQRLAP